MYVAMVSGPRPPRGDTGRLWRAIDDAPAYCRISHHDDAEPPAVTRADPEVAVWIGRLRWSSAADASGQGDPEADAGGLLIFAQEPRPGDEDEFDAWMETEHLPRLAGVPGTLLARQYEAIEGQPRFAAMYYLHEPAVCTSDEWRAASRTAWRDRMSGRNQNRRRGLYVPGE